MNDKLKAVIKYIIDIKQVKDVTPKNYKSYFTMFNHGT